MNPAFVINALLSVSCAVAAVVCGRDAVRNWNGDRRLNPRAPRRSTHAEPECFCAACAPQLWPVPPDEALYDSPDMWLQRWSESMAVALAAVDQRRADLGAPPAGEDEGA